MILMIERFVKVPKNFPVYNNDDVWHELAHEIRGRVEITLSVDPQGVQSQIKSINENFCEQVGFFISNETEAVRLDRGVNLMKKTSL